MSATAHTSLLMSHCSVPSKIPAQGATGRAFLCSGVVFSAASGPTASSSRLSGTSLRSAPSSLLLTGSTLSSTATEYWWAQRDNDCLLSRTSSCVLKHYTVSWDHVRLIRKHLFTWPCVKHSVFESPTVQTPLRLCRGVQPSPHWAAIPRAVFCNSWAHFSLTAFALAAPALMPLDLWLFLLLPAEVPITAICGGVC